MKTLSVKGEMDLIPILANGFKPSYPLGIITTKQALNYDASFRRNLTPILEKHHLLQKLQITDAY